MEAFYENRRYLLSHVNMTGHVDTKGITRLSLTTGSFGGTAVGEGAEFSAEINFKEKELPSTISFTAKGVDPSSLGLGDDIHDKMTLTALGSGPFAHPEARGTLTMEELHIPSLDFYDLKGDIHYQEGFLTFTDVKARVYGGTVTASGDYHMDSRAYNIYLHGERLDSRIPSNDPKFYCLVTLDGEIHCPGDSKSLTAFGRFSSGPGFYALIPFESITGTFNNRYRAVDFYDVSIDTRFGTFRTDAFHIWNGKLHLGAIEFIDKNTGEAINLHDIQNREGPEKTVEKIRKNVKSIKQQVHELSVK